MTPGVIAGEEKLIDDLENQFHEKVKSFTLNVSS